MSMNTSEKKAVSLSDRMKQVVAMVDEGARVCDIGCDHAFVSIYLAANDIAPHVIASDVRTGPCDIARENINAWGVADKVELRLGDGLATIKPGEADTIIIAGMGGMLMKRILESGADVVARASQLVLQPQSDIDQVRAYLHTVGFEIVKESFFMDMGKYYVVINAKKTDRIQAAEDDIYLQYGRYLINEKNETLIKYLKEQRELNLRILNGMKDKNTDKTAERIEELKREISRIDTALDMMK